MRKAVLLVALGLSSPAFANAFESFGFGSRSIGMADAMTAEANDFTAVWYNPALLVNRHQLNFGLSFGYQGFATSVTPANPGPNQSLNCVHCTPDPTVGYSLGLLFPLGGKVKDRVAIGLGIYLPSVVLLRTAAADPNQPFWYMYSGSPERIVVVTGLGIKVHEKVNVGIGVQALADLIGSGATVSVDLFSKTKTVTTREIDSHLANRVGPVAGLLVQPMPELRIGASFRYEMYLHYDIPASVDLQGIGTLAFDVQGIAHYSPHTFNLGVAYDLSPQLTIAVDGNYQLWSLAPSPYLNLGIQLSGPTLTALGLGNAFNMNSPQTPPGFSNTLAGRVGVEYRVSDRFAARGGVFYRQTPVPKQDAAGTNILDGDQLGISGGAGVAFADPLEIFQEPIKIDAALQGSLLLGRHATKDRTDSVPSYDYSGRSFGLNVGIRYDF